MDRGSRRCQGSRLPAVAVRGGFPRCFGSSRGKVHGLLWISRGILNICLHHKIVTTHFLIWESPRCCQNQEAVGASHPSVAWTHCQCSLARPAPVCGPDKVHQRNMPGYRRFGMMADWTLRRPPNAGRYCSLCERSSVGCHPLKSYCFQSILSFLLASSCPRTQKNIKKETATNLSMGLLTLCAM